MSSDKLLFFSAAISTGAIAIVYWLIRRMIIDFKSEMEKALTNKTVELWSAVNSIRERYLEEEKHKLICGKNGLEIEKMFEQKFKEHENAVFKQLREIIVEIKKTNGG